MEAISHPNNLVKKAKAMGLPALAITDYNGMYGIPAFYLAAKEAGINAILGVELGFVLDLKGNYLTKYIGNMCLLAINDEGYYNLMKLTSFANQEGIEGKPKIDFTTLKTHHEGIIVFYGGTESRVGKMILSGEPEERILEIHEMIQEVFQENCYFEITAQEEELLSELPKVNQLLLHLARKTDTLCIVNNNYFYPEPKDKPIREMALAIKDNMKMYDAQRRQPVGEYHLMTEEEIKKICLKNGYKEEQIAEWIENNEHIAAQAHAKIHLGQALFPVYETPEEIKQLYDQHKDKLIENSK
ncbi:MAG: PHP domain-containing protein [Candidatus Peribacteria bacterium]|nr:PHP domain-containing protein [Candidatus Peribacteria bacterium]